MMPSNRFSLLTFAMLAIPQLLIAKEDCPVKKIRQALGLAMEVSTLTAHITPQDSKLDEICLKLGRVTAILLRTQGSNPAPPDSWGVNAREIEGFCGVGFSPKVPRGMTNLDYASKQGAGGFKEYLDVQIAEMDKYIATNKTDILDVCKDPPPVQGEAP